MRKWLSRMPRRWRILLIVILGLYLFTWIGGWLRIKSDLDAEAWNTWRRVTAENAKTRALFASEGFPAPQVEVRPGGPATRVVCVPLLPGVLYTYTSSVIGPLWGHGGWSVMIYYGFGTVEVYRGTSWVS